MDIILNKILIENFKAFGTLQEVPLSDLSVFMGANSSGKSTALQTLLLLKQTRECNSLDIDLLLSGKYVKLGAYDDVINDVEKDYIKIGVSSESQDKQENYGDNKDNSIIWKFQRDDNKNGHIGLAKITLNVDDESIILEKGIDEYYNVTVNGGMTRYVADISHLELKNFQLEYDEELNEKFREYLNELSVCLMNSSKAIRINKNNMVAFYGVNTFYAQMCKEVQKIEDNDVEEQEEARITNIIKELDELIEEYALQQVPDFSIKSILIPVEIRKKILIKLIDNIEKIEQLELILKKNNEILRKYKKQEHIYAGRTSILNNMHFYMQNDRKNGNTIWDKINFAFMYYNNVFENIFEKILYVGPLREKPQGLYNIGFETIPKYVGPTGAYFASVLLTENKKRNYILPNGEIDNILLAEALDEWAVHLNIASEISVSENNSFGFNVLVSNVQRKKADIMNVGIGTSQVLPVLITGLISEPGEVLIFEQPELHLHPYSQSRLADFFIALIENGRRIIIESHSEYFVLRLRYYLLAKKVDARKVSVNFFQNTGETMVIRGEMTEYGDLKYPKDFKDETQALINDLMDVALVRRKR